AAESLGSFGSEAEQAIPTLIGGLHDVIAGRDVSPAFGWSAARALGRIAPKTKSGDAALAALTDAALHGAPQVRIGAISALAAFGPNAAIVAPQLRAWQSGSDPYLAKSATAALKAIEAAPVCDGKGDGNPQDRAKP